MPNDLTFAVRITADGRELASAAGASTAALDGIGQASVRAQSQAEKLNATLQFQNQWFAQTEKSAREQSVALAETSAAVNKLLDRYDPLSAKLRQLQNDFKALSAAAASGNVAPRDDARLDAVYARIQQEISAASAAASGFGTAAGGAMDKAAAATARGMFATVQARRELVVLGHEALSGNFSRMPGSLMVLAERANLSAASFLGMGGAVVGVAAAAAVLAVAMHSGAEEQKAMQQALNMTADFSGKSETSLLALAAAVSQSGQLTIGESKDMVTALAASGEIGAGAFDSVTKSAMLYSQASGKAADETAKDLVKLFADPSRGAEELNRKLGFLTVAELEHIRKLQEMGDVTGAQAELSEKLNAKLATIQPTLGTLGQAWEDLRKWASGAWDAMMNVGKTDTLDERLLKAAQQLKALKSAGGYDAETQGSSATYQTDLARAQALVKSLAAEKVARDSDAAAARDQADANKAAMATFDLIKSRSDAYTAASLLHTRERIDGYKAENAAQQKYKDQAIKSIDDQIAALGKPKDQTALSNAIAAREKAEFDALAAIEKGYLGQSLAALDANLKLKLISEETYYKGKQDLSVQAAQADLTRIQQEAMAEQEALSKSTKPEEKERHLAKLIELGGKAVVAQLKLNDASTIYAEHVVAEEIKKTDEYIDKLNKLENSKSDAIKLTNDYVLSLKAGNDQRDLELSLMGQSETARAIAIGQYQIEKELQAQILKIKMATADEDERARQIGIATNAAAAAKENLAAYIQINEQMKEWNNLWSTVEKTGKDAFVHLFSEGKSAFEGIGKAIKASVIDLLYQLTARKWIISIGTSLAGSLGIAGTANAAGGSMSLLSTGSSAYSLFGGSGGGLLGGAGDLVGGLGSAIGSSVVSGIGSGLAMAGQNIAAAGFFDGMAASTSLAIESASAGAWGTALGAAMPALGVIGAGIGLLNAFGAFGGKEEISGQGVTMDVRGASALGGSWTSYHQDGGWFGDDNNRKTGAPLSAAQMSAVNNTLLGVYGVVRGFADQVGDPSILRRLDDFSASYNGAADGLDAWLKSVTESMLATALPGLEQFRRAGEDTQAVITRLAQTLQTIKDLTNTIDGQISVMSGDVSQYGYEMNAANRAISDLYETLGNTTDIQARVEIEGKLYQQVNARYQLEQNYLGELSGVLTQSLQSVRDARAAVGSSMSGIAGTPAPTVADLRAAIAGSVTGLSLPSMQPVIDANLAMQQAAAAFKTESDRVAESNKEVRTTIASIPNIGGWAFNGHEQISEFNTLMDLARNAGILAAGTMNYSNYRDSNAVISLKDGYRFTLDGAGIGQTANISHSQDWVDVNGIGWSRFNRALGMEYYKPQGYEQVGAGVTAAVTDTAAAYQKAQDNYTAAMQAFAGDATRATEKLQGLREETIKYYDAQKQLADLMRQSADALGQTITSLTRANMVPVSRYDDMRAEFDRLLAGAAGLGGADLAARATQLNSLAQPLMDAARESYASSPAYQQALNSITGSLADLQARLGAEAPRDYQAESLALLSGIDAALGYIETNLASADQQIVAAINASRDSTVAVLQDIRALLGGEQSTLSGLPGHADGLSWVPYDNYGARLHQGEAVIDAGTMAGLRRYGIGAGGGGSPEQLAEQRKTNEELRALVRLQSAANQALLEKLEAMEKRLGGIESKSRMVAAA